LFYIVNDKERQSILNRSVIRKIFSVLNCQYIVGEDHSKVLDSLRSLGEWICISFLKSEFQNYDSVRHAYDLQIIQKAIKAGK